MPVQSGEYVQLTESEVQDALETELQAEFGSDIDLTESSVFATLADVLSTVLAANQEESLQEVYQSAFLETATGVDLERVVAIVGIQRRDAVHATGAERFTSNDPILQDFNIQNGTTVQTGSSEPTTFETTEQVSLKLVDSFEDDDIAEYSGDTGDFTTVSSNPKGGTIALQGSATSGSHIYNDDIVLRQGSVNHCYVRPDTNTIPIVTFFVQSSDPDDYYQIAVDNTNDELRLERVDDSTVATTIDSATNVGITDNEYHEIEWTASLTEDLSVAFYDKDDNELATLSGSDSTYTRGFPGFKSGDSNGTKLYDLYTQSAVTANIRAEVGGISGNVGPNAITTAPSLPSGVDSITNPFPTGDETYEDTNQDAFTPGRDEETDEDLRERANDAVTEGGDATHDAIVSTLVNDVTGVTSVTVFENKTDTDNTPSGLPPHSFEAVVFGGNDQDVANAIFNKKAVTARDYSGANGSTVSQTVTSDANGQQFTIEFSRPNKVDVDVELDILTNDEYVGDDALRDRIVRYIGGTLSNGNSVEGLGVAEDVFIDEIRDIVIGDETGVPAFDQNVDGDVVETTPSSTTVNGIEVVDIGANEVAQSDATDASITINKRSI